MLVKTCVFNMPMPMPGVPICRLPKFDLVFVFLSCRVVICRISELGEVHEI